MAMFSEGSGVVFMKVGVHAQESLEDIIKRKQDEFAAAGRIFWGYGGNTCHPRTIVQPFARKFESIGQSVHLIMHRMNSKHFEAPELAKEYSEDGVSWYAIPDGIEVRGSMFGMVIGGLTEEEFDFNLRSAIVSVGPSRGKRAADYLKGQADKGCFELLGEGIQADEESTKRITLTAPLVAPYAVFLR
ncbi:MAG: hypothetical protein H6953_07445 [Chromatiaceae bacterium]|nr:hypothetical protein [Chromatiaceae bacterium]MCP5315223.1 hypothetical protein [Chromatiaceae bacterium]MCP5428650.1 hypothetical protein [Chromatiaceae bacterium]